MSDAKRDDLEFLIPDPSGFRSEPLYISYVPFTPARFITLQELDQIINQKHSWTSIRKETSKPNTVVSIKPSKTEKEKKQVE